MQLLLALIVAIYLVGVGVVLSPVIQASWNTEPASVVVGDIGQALPERARLAGQGGPRGDRVLNT